MLSDGISRNHISDSVYDSMRLPGKIVAFSTDDAGFHDDPQIKAKGKINSHESDWPVIPSYGKGKQLEF